MNHKEAVHAKKKTYPALSSELRRESQLGLKSLMIDTSQSPKSSLVGRSSPTCTTPIHSKLKKGTKRTESHITKLAANPDLSLQQTPPSSTNWQHFLRESSRVDSWEHQDDFSQPPSYTHIKHSKTRLKKRKVISRKNLKEIPKKQTSSLHHDLYRIVWLAYFGSYVQPNVQCTQYLLTLNSFSSSSFWLLVKASTAGSFNIVVSICFFWTLVD